MAYRVGAGMALATAAAHAECPLQLVPPDSPAAWTTVAGVATRRLATASAHDCQSVEVAVRPSGGALLTFITTDGRRAVRALMSPDELAPALDALLVTLPAESVPAESVEPAATPVATTKTEDRPAAPAAASDVTPVIDSAAPTPPLPATPEVHFRMGASVGARFGYRGAYLAPALGLRPSGTFGQWELAGALEYDPAYAYLPGTAPPGFRLWSFVAAVQVGRSQALGGVALGYGVGLGVASLREEADAVDGTTQVTDFGQPRASAYARVAFPQGGTWRGTLDLGLDAVLGSVKRRATLRQDLPNLPRWGALLSVGLETTAL